MKATTATAFSLLSLAFKHHAKAAPTLFSRQTANIPSHSNVDVHTTLLGTTWPWREYKSSSAQPPNITITGNGGELAEGLIFMTPSAIVPNATKSGGGYIMRDNGDLVHSLGDNGMTDLRMQTTGNESYITYWIGYNSASVNIGHGYGIAEVLDNEYNTKTVVDPNVTLNTNSGYVNAANGTLDIHEHQLTEYGTMMVTAYNNTPADLSSIGGPKDGWIADSYALEVDLATNETIFIWRASEHVPFNASHKTSTSPPFPGVGTQSSPYDWFHINSIERVGDNYLINSRHCWTSFFVAKNGTILWELSGDTGGSFGALPDDGTFSWQHYVRAHNVTETSMDISIFDNHNNIVLTDVVPTTATRMLVYHLELPPSKSYSPVLTHRVVTDSDKLYSYSQGFYDPSLSNGNQFVGYGQISVCREYGPATDGSDLRWQGRFGANNEVQNYRCQKAPWSATPAAWDPSLVVDDGQVYVSWDGATDVESWNVYTGTSNSSLALVGNALWAGFETVFAVPSGAQFVQVGAVQGGEEVRKSNVASV